MHTRLLCAVVLAFGLAACANAAERPYRLPYANGVAATFTADQDDHSSPDAPMFDIRATLPNQVLAAAAPGWVRFIKDTGNSSEPTNNYVWIEHPLDYCQPAGSAPPGNGGLVGPCRECPEGLGHCNEWTLYAHMREGSVTLEPPAGAGLVPGQWVVEGQAIGVEGDVGFTPCPDATAGQALCGRHVHFAVFVFEESSILAQPTENGDYEAYAKMYGRPERVPLFCTAGGHVIANTGETHVAGACQAP